MPDQVRHDRREKLSGAHHHCPETLSDPYKGVELIARIGQPALNRHSLQIEIRRPVYMDEATRQPNAGFDRLRGHLAELTAQIAQYVRGRLGLSQLG